MASLPESSSSNGSEAVGAAEEESTKKLSKKEAAKLERQRRRQELAAASASLSAVSVEEDPLAANYGDVPLVEMQSKARTGRVWTKVEDLDKNLEGEVVCVRGRAQTLRAVGKKICFIVLRKEGYTVQCVLTVAPDVSPQMVKFANGLSKESIVDIEGVVSVPDVPIKGATQQVEIQVRKLYCISRALPVLPVNIDDAARSEAEIEKAEQAGEKLVRVNQDTRLNNRVLDLRTPANRAIFKVQSEVAKIFQDVLISKGFVGIHTPKLIAGSSEGGSSVFKLNYKGQPACLAQSPQLHKQMSFCTDFGRVFEIGHVYRAEDSFTHRHLCEFVGLDVEMEINEHYTEVMDLVDELFVKMFDEINKNCQKELEAINRQYPFEPLKLMSCLRLLNLKYTRPTLKLTFEEGIQMLKEAGVEVDPLGDLNTEAERKLGQLVLEKYGTEFYILHRYPQAVRPFYTMP